MSEFIRKKKIGEILIDMGVLSEEQLFWGLEKQIETKELIGQILIQAEYINEVQLAMALGRQFNVDYMELEEYMLNEELMERVPETLVKMYYSFPTDSTETSSPSSLTTRRTFPCSTASRW